MESSFSFLPFFKVLWQRLLWIILCAVIGGATGYYVLKANYEPIYSSGTQIDVHRARKLNEDELARYNTDVARTSTIQSEIADSGIYETTSRVINEKQGVSIPETTIRKNVSVTVKPSSTILAVTAKSNSAYKASLIANTIVKVFRAKYTKIDKRLVVLQLSPATASKAYVSRAPYASYIKNGAAIGFVVSYLLFLLVYYFQYRRNRRRPNHSDQAKHGKVTI